MNIINTNNIAINTPTVKSGQNVSSKGVSQGDSNVFSQLLNLTLGGNKQSQVVGQPNLQNTNVLASGTAENQVENFGIDQAVIENALPLISQGLADEKGENNSCDEPNNLNLMLINNIDLSNMIITNQNIDLSNLMMATKTLNNSVEMASTQVVSPGVINQNQDLTNIQLKTPVGNSIVVGLKTPNYNGSGQLINNFANEQAANELKAVVSKQNIVAENNVVSTKFGEIPIVAQNINESNLVKTNIISSNVTNANQQVQLAGIENLETQGKSISTDFNFDNAANLGQETQAVKVSNESIQNSVLKSLNGETNVLKKDGTIQSNQADVLQPTDLTKNETLQKGVTTVQTQSMQTNDLEVNSESKNKLLITNDDSVITNNVEQLFNKDNTFIKVSDVSSELKSSVNNQIADKIIVSSQKGNSQFEMDLFPSELGKVSVKMAVKNGLMTIEILAQNPKTQQLLASSAGEIKTLLGNLTNNEHQVIIHQNNQQQEYFNQQNQNSQQQNNKNNNQPFSEQPENENNEDKPIDFVSFFNQLNEKRRIINH